MGRVKEWQHDDPGSTIPFLAKWLGKHDEKLMALGPEGVYTSTDFGSGKNSALLQELKTLIAEAFVMDPRGAYFNRQHLHEAWRLVFHASDEGTTPLRKRGAKAYQSEAEVLDMFAYKLRVMIAHSRTMEEHTPKR